MEGYIVARKEILIAGSGKIGSLIAVILGQTEDYHVHLVDIVNHPTNLSSVDKSTLSLTQHILNVEDKQALTEFAKAKGITAVVSCLPYFCNRVVAEFAKENQLHYFDLTEDTSVFESIKKLAANATTAFVPQCGLAPGFINIVATDLMKKFSQVQSALLRVGALPAFSHNAFGYALNWSTDGLINEYGNPCFGIIDSKQVTLHPLEDLESISIDGIEYEAFNTSGGVGNLTDAYQGKVETMNYKTLRYPGHCEKMRLLMNDLKLNKDRANLKQILEAALPRTKQDVVVIYVAIDGLQQGEYIEEHYVKKIYPKEVAGKKWAAIQISTAASACAIIDIVMQNPGDYKGLVLQESFGLDTFLQNRFGHYYQ